MIMNSFISSIKMTDPYKNDIKQNYITAIKDQVTIIMIYNLVSNPSL